MIPIHAIIIPAVVNLILGYMISNGFYLPIVALFFIILIFTIGGKNG